MIRIREYKPEPDIDKIRSVAGNATLDQTDVFDFGTFIIARSGLNRNFTDITPEGQHAAVKEWVGKPIYYRDHETEARNQIGRIYDAWVADDATANITTTFGRGYGIITDDLRDIFKRIEGGIHREMSCAYEPVVSLCSCGANLDKATFSECQAGHRVGTDGFYALDMAFKPDHISFVGRPAVEGAGLIAAEAENKVLRIFGVSSIDEAEQALRELRRDADDGRAYRAMIQDEFTKWFGLAHPDAGDNEVRSLAAKLSAKEMTRLARIERERVHELLPAGGAQMSVAVADEGEAEPAAPAFNDVKDLFRKG